VNVLQQMGIVAILSLLVAIVPAVMGVAYAIWPTESNLALMRPLSLASLFAAFGGFVGGLINALHSVAGSGGSITSGPVLTGIAESIIPLFVCFGSLTIAWLLVALGMRRHV
jgi:hypothetical protein